VVNYPVDGGCRREGVLEDLVPFREDQVRSDLY
jgi:hypothetical protein